MRTISILLALVLAVLPSSLDAQTMVCGPNGCTYQRAPVRSFFRPSATVYRTAAPQASTRSVVVRRGLFGRRVVTARYAAPIASASYGSSGGVSQASSYGSSGGYQSAPVAQSYGSSGGLAQPPAVSTPPAEVDDDRNFRAEPTASVPQAQAKQTCPCGDDCRCGPNCQCETLVARVPSPEPVTLYARLPSVEPVTSYARVPKSLGLPEILVASR